MANSFYEDQVRRNRLYAQSLLAQGSDTSPVGHPLAAVARAVQGAMGGYIDYKDEQKDKNDLREMGQFYLNNIQGGQQQSTPSVGNAAPMNTPPMGNLPRMNSRIYDQNEFNPMDAAVATQGELGAGVPAPKQYAALIGKAAVDNDIPPQLLAAQIKQESGFNPNAVSSAGATGISQFMPATAREMGVTNPRDPNQAIPAGAQYLRQNIDKFGGSVPLGLAAYNAGPGRVQRSGGDISRLPAETQGYVKNITGAAPMQTAQAQPDSVQMIAKMLSSDNPRIQREGFKLSQALTAQQATLQLARQNRDPLDVEAKQLDIAAKRKGLDAPPTVQRIKQPDGSEVAVQWDAQSKAWVPLKAPEGGNPVASPKLTEQQSKDVGFYNRGQKLLPRLEQQDQALTDPASAVGGSISNYLKSDDYRRAEQTGRELLAVILRKDTGAAVTPSEMEQYSSIYLPKPGDDAATIQQKRVARQTAMDGLRMGLGTADIIFKSREAAEAAKPAAPAQAPKVTKTIGGKTYFQENGQWFEQ
jgi:hypothetical protein